MSEKALKIDNTCYEDQLSPAHTLKTPFYIFNLRRIKQYVECTRDRTRAVSGCQSRTPPSFCLESAQCRMLKTNSRYFLSCISFFVVFARYLHTKIKCWLIYHDRSIERSAEHEAKRTEQMAKGMLERQKLTNEKVSIYCPTIWIKKSKKSSSQWCHYGGNTTKTKPKLIIIEITLVSFLCVATRRAVYTG